MTILDLAPHCALPPMDGADKRAWFLYDGLVADGLAGTFVGRTACIKADGSRTVTSRPDFWRDKKTIAALVAFATGRDYWQYKALSPNIKRTVSCLKHETYDIVLVNFLYALPLLRSIPKPYRLLIDTHNYDPACFSAMCKGTRNPVIRILCDRAIECSINAISRLPLGTVMVHVSDRDASLYRQQRPDLEHVVVENGTLVQARKSSPEYNSQGKRILQFVGSLSAKMNQDALRHFAGTFWPHLCNHAECRIVGSAPPKSVRDLCAQSEWRLYENVSENQLTQLYDQAHFAILPFAYGEGSKLKLFEACGRGVPVLSTLAGVVGVNQLPPLVFVSDNPSDWLRQLTSVNALPDQDIDRTLAFAEEFSWPRLARRLSLIAQKSPPIEQTNA